MSNGPTTILMTPDEVLPLKRAAEYAQRNDSTMKRWVKKHGIGRQAGSHGRIEVSILGLSMVLHEDWPALEALKAGHRSSPLVRRHIDHLGLPG